MTSRNDKMSLILSGLIFVMSGQAMGAEISRRDLSADELIGVQGAVSAMLRDPDSAQFKNVIAADVGGGKVVLCGEVNAKNGAGGMAGFSRFYGNLNGKIVIAEGSLGTGMAGLFCSPIEKAQ